MQTTTTKIYETTNGLAVLPDSEAPIAGKVVWWELHGSVPLQTINNALEAAGLTADWSVPAAQPRDRLERAMKAAAGSNEIVRPARGHGGMVLVKESYDAETANSYQVEFRCWYIREDDGEATLHCSDPSDPRFARVMEAWEASRAVATVNDISVWMSRRAPACSSVSLRRTGGYHFIPASALTQWQKVVDALHSTTSCLVYDLPVHSKATAITAVLRALVEEAEDAMATIESRRAEGTMNARGIRSRQAEMEEMVAKISRYESSLGVTLTKVRQRADSLRNSLAADLLEEG